MLGKISNNNSNFKSYAFRSYVSTGIGQFCDNLTFALIVSHQFFGWTLVQCVVCAFTGMIVETLCEVIFSYPGTKINKGSIGYRKLRIQDTAKAYLTETKKEARAIPHMNEFTCVLA